MLVISDFNITVKIIVLALAALLFCLILLPRHSVERGAEGEALAASKPLLITYIYDGADIAKEDLERLDQVNFAFAGIKNGLTDDSIARSIKAFSSYMADYPKVRTVISIGGYGMDGFSGMASTAEGRQRFAESAISLLHKYGFRGIDIDWEYPGISAGGIASTGKDRDNFTLLIKALRAEIDAYNAANGKDCILTAAVGASREHVDLINWSAVSPLLDQVLVMTYDMSGFTKELLHHTALFETENGLGGAESLLAYESAGIPREKLILGGAMYARVFEVSASVNAPGGNGKTTGVKTISYSGLEKLVSEYPETAGYDESAEAPYFIHSGKLYTYDNARSVAAKARYVAQNGFGGLMFWEYSQGKALIKAAYDNMK